MTTTFVFLLRATSRQEGSRLRVAGSMSTKTGMALFAEDGISNPHKAE